MFWNFLAESPLELMNLFLGWEITTDIPQLTIGLEINAEGWRGSLTKDPGIVGETLEGSNEAPKISGYGALQISYQGFYGREDLNWSKLEIE